MKKTRFTDEQMVTILREADQRPVPEVAKRHGVSAQTIYSWRKHFGTLEPANVKRLRQLEQENGRLKKMVADRDLEIDVLQEITRKKWWRTCAPAAGRVCAPTRAVESPRVRRVIRRAVDARLPGAAPAARCAGPGDRAQARGPVSAVRLPEDPDLSRAPGAPDACRTDLSAVAPGGPARTASAPASAGGHASPPAAAPNREKSRVGL